MKTRQWMRAGLIGLLMGVVGGAGQAGAQPAPVTRAVKTDFSYGEADDLVVASVVETGVRTGASQVVTLQIVNLAGSVVAQTTGAVDQEIPLRLAYRIPTASPVFARAIASVSVETTGAAVVTLERWSPSAPSSSWSDPVICYFELVPMPRPPPPPPGPVTLKCEPIVPPPPQ